MWSLHIIGTRYVNLELKMNLLVFLLEKTSYSVLINIGLLGFHMNSRSKFKQMIFARCYRVLGERGSLASNKSEEQGAEETPREPTDSRAYLHLPRRLDGQRSDRLRHRESCFNENRS